ncbi:acyltransferase [Aliivibrio sp. S4TY2]|uniref:acyltransferase family protein n=1 Tax=Aliivibrio TaxID=511678 RepID=UPI0010226543|nr:MULTISPECIES: acyltransferase [Aliivibrio]MDD9156058.1 acyltransferase [Aliivibrio sp. S4TY2]MDD9159767.1 acyltransferase [Aliivibrio sp. S4TY1]MDD9163765.1 acyltransferase [Aliivibrio sp. S4MY2]MDD9167767.1 acyltransferase [Aliivibrio sp. S4MY4]MDD9185569.1 acyltransferase [Aliivibrio sp. S4MY3]
MYLNSFTHFRAIAIIFIVAAHVYNAAGIQFDNFGNILFQNFIAGGTSLFVFISGFLFFHVFCQNFNFTKFYKNKLKFVLVPYLILGFLPLIFHVLSFKEDWGGYFYPQGNGIIHEYFIPALKYYATGRFMAAYWYIPFAVILFSMSPLHRKFAYLNARTQLSILTVLTVIAVFVHRPVDNMSIIQSLIYFTPVYLTGIFCSVHYERCINILGRFEFLLLAGVLMISLIQTYLGFSGNYHKPALVYEGIDLVYIQKILLCLFLMIFLKRYDDKNHSVITLLASTSFSIYFLHIYFTWTIGVLNKKVSLGLDNGSWITYFILLFGIIICCISIAKLIKKLFPTHSRYMIGY